MSIRVKIEQHNNDTFKVTLDRGDFSVRGVSVGIIASLLKFVDNDKFKVGKSEVEKMITSMSHVNKNNQDRKLLEAFMLQK